MGTAIFSIGKYAKSRGSAAGTIIGELVTSGSHTTSTTATNLTDGAAGAGTAIVVTVGTVLRIQVDVAARVNFGGSATTAIVGHIIFANQTFECEFPESGLVSIADVA